MADDKVNDAAAAETAGAYGSDCNACKRTGLPIFPLRHTVINKSCSVKPLPKGGVRVPTHPLTESKYIARTLRQGYIYVLLQEKGATTKTWDCYQVTPKGFLRKISTNDYPLGEVKEIASQSCLANNDDIKASFINIDTTMYDQAWIGFAHDPWSEEVLDYYEKGDASKLARFTHINVELFKNDPAGQNGFELSGNSFLSDHVAEFGLTDIGKDNSAFAFYSRVERRVAFDAVLAQLNGEYGGKVSAIVLEDIIGNVIELNHIRLGGVKDKHDFMNRPRNKYYHMTSLAIDTYKQALESNFLEKERQRVSAIPDNTGTYRSYYKEKAKQNFEEEWAKYEEQIDLVQKDKEDDYYIGYMQHYDRVISASSKDYSLWANKDFFWQSIWKNEYQCQSLDESQSTMIKSTFGAMMVECLDGGVTEPIYDVQDDAKKEVATRDLWLDWFKDKDSPVYAALFLNNSQITDALTDKNNFTLIVKSLFTIPALNGASGAKVMSIFNAIDTRLIYAITAGYSAVYQYLTDAQRMMVELAADGKAYLANGQVRIKFKVEMTAYNYFRIEKDFVTRPTNLFGQVPESQKAFEANGKKYIYSDYSNYFFDITDDASKNKVVSVNVMMEGTEKEIRAKFKSLGIDIDSPSSTTVTHSDLNNKLGKQKIVATYAAFLDEVEGKEWRVGQQAFSDLLIEDRRKITNPYFEHLNQQRQTKSGNVGGVGNVLNAIMLLFQVSLSCDNFLAINNALGVDKQDAKAKMVSSTLMSIGLLSEIVGNAILKGSTYRGVFLVKFGGVLGAFATINDGYINQLKSSRAASEGNLDAKFYYRYSSICFYISGGLGALGSLWGNHWVLLASAIFLIGGIILAAIADSKKISIMQIWFARCIYSKPNNRLEKKWKNESSLEELEESMGFFNLILSGVSIDVKFTPEGSGYTPLDIVITIPKFLLYVSGFNYTLALNDSGGKPISHFSYSMNAGEGSTDRGQQPQVGSWQGPDMDDNTQYNRRSDGIVVNFYEAKPQKDSTSSSPDFSDSATEIAATVNGIGKEQQPEPVTLSFEQHISVLSPSVRSVDVIFTYWIDTKNQSGRLVLDRLEQPIIE